MSGIRIGRPGFRFRAAIRISLVAKTFRPALLPTQPPMQWPVGVLSLAVKWSEREPGNSLPSSAELKNA
jgi:hypothetical protein